jgi:hypothetical protein
VPLAWKDRIKVASATTGTGTLTLGAAASGFQTFAAGDDAKLFAYVIEDGTAWETGYGTYTHAGTLFARTTRTDSSTGAAISCSGAENLFVDLVSNIADTANLAAQAITPGGRLTLETGVPVSTTDQAAKTSIFYTPYVHNIINLWDGNIWKCITFSEVTLALGTLTSAKPYDVFGFLNAGALNTELLAWTSDTARATAVTFQDGRYCKSGDKTRLLLGTFYTTATTTTEDSEKNRLVDNIYNTVLRRCTVTDNTSHTYNSATVRSWNNTSTARCQIICSFSKAAAVATRINNTTAANGAQATGMGINSTTAFDSPTKTINNAATALAFAFGGGGHSVLPLGFSFIQALEQESSALVSTFAFISIFIGVPQ